MITPVIVLGSTGFVAGLGLFIASKKFAVEKDPKIEEVDELLPGANCGACGLPGCSSLAEAIVKGDVLPSACPVADNESVGKIAELLGIEAGTNVKHVARVKCNGGCHNSPEKYKYYGPGDCHSITMLAGGNKECIYGCVGGGSCVKACAFNAMEMGEDKIPRIFEDKCTACGMCVKACPRDIIELMPIENKFVVNCCSKDKGPETKKACSVGCIACRLCAKNCPVDAITVENNLAKIDPEICTNCGKCEEVCPMKTINNYCNHCASQS
ncbi:electron transport complex, RnfABCDGE type, B subunit [Flexistipes sinusarabici DSM 4947]|uniref:Ion-translocating oxidoreductase complex subunit B n=1 Tax=Flexistipes sinusarabici (strain ATCC 49648 / DSM 4947 / MAS 10) TaxID=717231 RepID=F8E899_FLESM|nr:RnfABCDGE type electron transport complex subunit B [Flexistipes sinusarabici]AEI15096.1 electron transport complex, RnfABCDGE type, B subunit [Flexistipes sinusarabici DSM 4947]